MEKPTKKKEKLSKATQQLLEKGRELIRKGARNIIEYTEINKTARKMAKQDINRFQEEQITQLIKDNKGIKIFRRNNSPRKGITKLKTENGDTIEERS